MLLHHACRLSLAAPPEPAAITAAVVAMAWAHAHLAAGGGAAAAGAGAGGLPQVCGFALGPAARGQAGGRHRVRACVLRRIPGQ